MDRFEKSSDFLELFHWQNDELLLKALKPLRKHFFLYFLHVELTLQHLGSEDEDFLRSLQSAGSRFPTISGDEFEACICALEAASLRKLLGRIRVRTDSAVPGGGTDEPAMPAAAGASPRPRDGRD